MRPHPRSRIFGPTARAHSHGPFRLVSITMSQSASVSSSIGPRLLTPALFTRMSIGPSSASTSDTSRVTCSASITSAANPRARRPVAAAISDAADSHASRERPEIATSAPASASACAMTRPSPRAPPVTSARRPSNRKRSRMFGMSLRQSSTGLQELATCAGGRNRRSVDSDHLRAAPARLASSP